MISINLKPGAKRAKAGAGMAGALETLKNLPGRIKDPWPMAAVASWVLVAGFLGWMTIGSVTTLGRLEEELTAARSANRRVRVLIAEKRRAEASKDSVITQIATIRAVDGDRYVWPHILDEIARAVPSYTWLTELSFLSQPVADSSATALPPVAVQLTGRTMDIQGFTRFMRSLEDSPWLGDVTLISTSTDIDHGRAVTVFTVKASYVRRAPAEKEG